MKWIAIIAVCLAVLLYIFQQPEVGLEQREDDLYYKASAETAFTGNGVVYHSNRQKAQEGEIEKGKPVGLWKMPMASFPGRAATKTAKRMAYGLDMMRPVPRWQSPLGRTTSSRCPRRKADNLPLPQLDRKRTNKQVMK